MAPNEWTRLDASGTGLSARGPDGDAGPSVPPPEEAPSHVDARPAVPSSLLARAITEIVTPDNVYDRPAPPR